MLIDWFTVAAQAANFLILVWLLKRFLYKPILNAVDSREKLIAAKLADADAKEANAKSDGDAFKQKSDEFDKQRAALLTKAADDAAAEGRKLLDAARQVADALSAKRREALRTDAHALDQTFQHRMQQEVFAASRKMMTDLACVDLDARMTEVFTRRLREMAGERKATFGAALASGAGAVLLRSAFDIPAEQRTAIQTALDDAFSTHATIRYETAPNLVSGLELSAGGQKISWNVSDYLGSVEKTVGDLLKDHDEPDPKTGPAPVAEAKTAPPTKTKDKSPAAQPQAQPA